MFLSGVHVPKENRWDAYLFTGRCLSMKIISNYTILVHSIDLSSKMRTGVKLFVDVFLNLVKIE